jgi:hypothetical protein
MGKNPGYPEIPRFHSTNNNNNLLIKESIEVIVV